MSWLDDIVKGALKNLLKDKEIIALLEGFIAKWYEAHKPVTPPAPPQPQPPPKPPDPPPSIVAEHINILDLTTFADQVRAAGYHARDSCIHYVFAAMIYGWPIPQTTGGEDPEYDGLMARSGEIDRYMNDLVDKVADRLKANPLATATCIVGDPNRPNYEDIDLQGQKYGEGILKRLRFKNAPMDRVELGVVTIGSI